MPTHSPQALTQHFYAWEERGRGNWLYDMPVALEPPFVPFDRSLLRSPTPPKDDGFHHTPISFLRNFLFPEPKKQPEPPAPKPPQPQVIYDHYTVDDPDQEVCEFQVRLATSAQGSLETMEQLLVVLATAHYPVSFEVIGTGSSIFTQFCCRVHDEALVYNQIKAFFPEVIITKQAWNLYSHWHDPHQTIASFDLTLEEEFMRPISMQHSRTPDPLTAVIAALERLKEGQLGMLQVLFHGLQHPWAKHMGKAVTDGKGGPFFADAPEMVPLTKQKVSAPLFAAVIRVLGIGGTPEFKDSIEIALDLYQAVSTTTTQVGSNAFQLSLEDALDHEDYEAAANSRKSYRPGMILNSRELLGVVHFLSPSVISSKFTALKRTKAVPTFFTDGSFPIGINSHQGEQNLVTLSNEDRLRHIHIIGATGTGKSTLLTHLIYQNMLQGQGCAVLDPHGDLVDDVLQTVPSHLKDKVVVIDPSDQNYAVGVNILEAETEQEKMMLASDLTAVFRRHTTSWGDQMEVILQNVIAAFLESERGGTLLDLRRFLLDPSFQKEFLPTVTDPLIQEYFLYDFPQKRTSSLQSLLSRLQFFLRPKPIRFSLMQQQGLNFTRLMDEGNIILCRLSQGLIGEANSYLLGSLLLTKFYQAALSRQAKKKSERTPFFLYIDEFQHFITPTLEGILSGARKYGLGLVLAHQSLDQLMKKDASVGNSVLTNAGTRICFRTSDTEAHQLAKGLSFFEASDIEQLGTGEAIVRLESSSWDCNLQVPPPFAFDSSTEQSRQQILTSSRATYATGIADLKDQLQTYTRSRTEKQQKPQKEAQELLPKSLQAPEEQQPEVSEQTEVIVPPAVPITPTQPLEEAAEAFKKSTQKKAELSEHRYLQSYIKQMAEARGYLATLEAPTPDGQGRVDVLLKQETTTLAIEIAVTTSNKHELGNIRKCLKAGYSQVILVTQKPKRLRNIEELAKKELKAKEFALVQFMTPNDLFPWLDQQVVETKSSEQTVKGYRVKVNYKTVSDQEGVDRQNSLSRIVSRSIKRKKP